MKYVDGPGHFLHSKEGKPQGYPLTMISCGIGILLIIHEICAMHPQVAQSFYADDAASGGHIRGPPGTHEGTGGEGTLVGATSLI